MSIKVDIETKVFIRLAFVILGFGLGLFAIYQTRSALLLLAISLFLALALNPPVSLISKRLPGNSRVGATAIAYLIVIALLGGFFVLVVPPVIEQSAKFANSVPGLIDDLAERRTLFDDFIVQYGLEGAVDQAVENAKDQAANIAANLGNTLVSGATATFSGLANMIFVLVLTFLMLIEGPAWLRRMWGLYDDQERLEKHRALVSQMYRVVTGFVNGQLMVAGIAAVCTIVFVLTMSILFDLPANLAVPLAVIIFLTYFVIYQQIENNFISPAIQSKSVELSALLILSAVLIGLTLGGLFGGIIAIPIAGCLRVLFMYQLENQKRVRESKTKNPIKRLAKKVKEA